MADTAKARVAFIGLGAMGGPMARRLVETGFDVIVWNRTPEKMKPLVQAGASAAKSPADGARRAGAVITMVADPQALVAVTEGEEGVVSAVAAGATVIQMSTVSPESTKRLASALRDGVALLDAPVLGSTAEAESGSLKVFVGGTHEVAERWTPMLSVLGTPMHVGDLGAGTAAKLIANSALLGTLCLLGEDLALARALGLSAEAAFEVLGVSPLAAQAERRRASLTSDEFPLRFSLSLALKDAGLIVTAAQDRGAEMRVAEAARAWLADGARAGLADDDYSTVLKFILDRARSSRR